MVNRVFETSGTLLNRKILVHYEATDGQEYFFVFRPDQYSEALRAPGRMVVATNGEFNWDDATAVCDIISRLRAYDDQE